MNKKRLLTIITILCFLCNFSYAQTATNDNQLTIEQVITKHQHELQLEQQKRDTYLKKIQEENKMAAQKTKQLEEQLNNPDKNNITTKSATTQSKTPNEAHTTKICNCNDPNSQYNYPDNYYYNKDGTRAYQIYPHCKCAKGTTASTQTTTTNPITTNVTALPINPNNTTSDNQPETQKQQSDTSYWNIHY